MRKESLTAAVLLALTSALGVVAGVFLVMGYPEANTNATPEWASIFGALGLTGVGALILAKSDARLIGVLFCLAGLAVQIENAGAGYIEYALDRHSSDLPLAAAVAVVADSMWVPTVSLGIVATFLLFPTGRALSHRWRPVLWLAITIAFLSLPLTLLAPGPLYYAETIDNPWGIAGAQQLIEEMQGLMFAGMWIPVFASIVCVILRYRRANPIERLQMKWFLFASALLVAGIPIGIALDPSVFGALLFEVLFALIPISVAVGILRYRLYDIDVILNRALVYGALTAILAAVYLGLVFALQQVFPLGDESDVAVAASTLTVAALFRPARARVQAFIDRRFFRSKYDAVATLDELSARLRSEVTIEDVQRDVLSTVSATVQPAHTSLWLRSSS